MPANETTANSIELRMSFDAVAPIYIPSQVKAAQPTTGIRSSQGRYCLAASITCISEVMTFNIGTPAK